MYERKYGNVLTIILVILIIVVVGLLGFLGVDLIKSLNNKKDAEEAANKFEEQFSNKVNEDSSNSNEIADVKPIIGTENTQISDETGEKVVTYKGFIQIGNIEIPKTGLKCPILQDLSKKSIEVAVALYYGPGLNEVGNTVIVGHNYRNGTLFSDNKLLTNGDKIYITDNKGKRVTYTIYNIEVIEPENTDYMYRDTSGKREISLLTCTDDVQSRLVIWAKEN